VASTHHHTRSQTLPRPRPNSRWGTRIVHLIYLEKRSFRRRPSSDHPGQEIGKQSSLHALIDDARLLRTDYHVPWDQWGEDPAFMAVPEHGDGASIFDQSDGDAHHSILRPLPHLSTYTFGFLRRYSSLPLFGEQSGETGRKASTKH
jgi:hypothetical protein